MILVDLDLTSLKNAIFQLEDSILWYGKTRENNSSLQKHVRGGSIQAFEFTYELTFKTLKRHLEKKHASSELIRDMTFDDIIRESFGSGIIRSDISVWREYRKNRGITSHTYDETKAQQVFECGKDFLYEAQYTLKQLQMRDNSTGQSN